MYLIFEVKLGEWRELGGLQGVHLLCDERDVFDEVERQLCDMSVDEVDEMCEQAVQRAQHVVLQLHAVHVEHAKCTVVHVAQPGDTLDPLSDFGEFQLPDAGKIENWKIRKIEVDKTRRKFAKYKHIHTVAEKILYPANELFALIICSRLLDA